MIVKSKKNKNIFSRFGFKKYGTCVAALTNTISFTIRQAVGPIVKQVTSMPLDIDFSA